MMLRIAPKQKLNVLVFSALGFFLAFSLLVLFPKYRAVRKLILDVRAAAAENTALEKQILTSKKSGTRLEEVNGMDLNLSSIHELFKNTDNLSVLKFATLKQSLSHLQNLSRPLVIWNVRETKLFSFFIHHSPV